jgi:hypothetical protein
MPTAHFMRCLSSTSPTQTVRLPSACSSARQSTGMNEVALWWCGRFHSTPPEIHAPSIPIIAGLMTRWR